MTYKYLTNQYPTTGGQALYLIKEHLKTCGWTHMASGDASTFTTTPGNVNDLITTAAKAATNRAWWVLQMPGPGTRQWLFQCDTGERNYRLKFSAASGFVSTPLNGSGTPTGSISATSCPSAFDQLLVNGGVNDTGASSPGTLFTAAGTYRLHGFADNASPGGFCFWTVYTGTPRTIWIWYLDPMAVAASGDPEPYVIHHVAIGAAVTPFGMNLTSYLGDETNGPLAPFKRTTGGGYYRCPGLLYGQDTSNIVAPGALMGVYGNEPQLPLVYARRAALAGFGGFKGVSSLFHVRLANRATMETMSVASARDRVVLDDVTTYWDGSVPLF